MSTKTYEDLVSQNLDLVAELDELKSDNEHIRMRLKGTDLLFGRLMLAMRAAVIEVEHGEGVTAGMAWVFNTLSDPGEFAPESEKDAQAYFNRESEIIDVEFAKCMEFFENMRAGRKG